MVEGVDDTHRQYATTLPTYETLRKPVLWREAEPVFKEVGSWLAGYPMEGHVGQGAAMTTVDPTLDEMRYVAEIAEWMDERQLFHARWEKTLENQYEHLMRMRSYGRLIHPPLRPKRRFDY